MMTRNKLLLLSLFVGGISFWLLEGLFSLIGHNLTAKTWVIIQTIALPIISVVVLLGIALKFKPEGAILNAFSMVFGIWFLSPFYVLIIMTFSGHGIPALKALWWQFIAFPMTAIMASTYSGGLYALIVASIVLPFAGIIITNKIESSNKCLHADAE